jgi:membrane protein implicated in regulation of membrane protease activity
MNIKTFVGVLVASSLAVGLLFFLPPADAPQGSLLVNRILAGSVLLSALPVLPFFLSAELIYPIREWYTLSGIVIIAAVFWAILVQRLIKRRGRRRSNQSLQLTAGRSAVAP